MPTYVYRIVSKDPNAPEQTFEIRQSMKDAPLTVHPDTGEPVERVICAPQVASPKGNSEIAAAGFTKYKKTSDGSYERLAGNQGPSHLRNPRAR
jgi:predicted nucleic acid-binding Zn ribbon protein